MKKRLKRKEPDRAPAWERIVADPLGMYTGYTADDAYEVPVQDADDL